MFVMPKTVKNAKLTAPCVQSIHTDILNVGIGYENMIARGICQPPQDCWRKVASLTLQFSYICSVAALLKNSCQPMLPYSCLKNSCQPVALQLLEEQLPACCLTDAEEQLPVHCLIA
jgi:hypothetical protein